jgi:hypothetical protein
MKHATQPEPGDQDTDIAIEIPSFKDERGTKGHEDIVREKLALMIADGLALRIETKFASRATLLRVTPFVFASHRSSAPTSKGTRCASFSGTSRTSPTDVAQRSCQLLYG